MLHRGWMNKWMRVDDGSSEVLPKVTALVALRVVIWEMAQEAGKGHDFQSVPTPPAPLHWEIPL